MAMTPNTPSRSRGLAPQGRTARIVDTTAVAATSAFAGGALVSQTVIVPGWRAMDPVAFLGLFAMLLIFFVPTNLGMLDPGFPPGAVPAELTTWYRWNWVRTGLGVASAGLACIALTVSRRGEDGARS